MVIDIGPPSKFDSGTHHFTAVSSARRRVEDLDPEQPDDLRMPSATLESSLRELGLAIAHAAGLFRIVDWLSRKLK